MKQFIKALKVLSKYTDSVYPSKCVQNEFKVIVNPSKVSIEDTIVLEDCHFYPDYKENCFVSYRFGGE